jgi:predicted dehydrogenase
VSAGPAPLRVALVGAGAWGRNLARVLGETPGVILAAVVDERLDRAIAAAVSVGAAVGKSLDERLCEGLDAVVVATPAEAHASVAHEALTRGLGVLVEKPLTLSEEEASSLIAARDASKAVGMVGHLLRFHPAVVAAARLVREGAIGELVSLSSQRLGPPSGALGSALWELAPHDLSVVHMLRLAPRGTLRVNEVGSRTTLTGRLGQGTSFSVALSRDEPTKVRRLVFEGTRGSLTHDDIGDPFGLALEGPRTKRRIEIAREEPLAREVNAFVAALRGEAVVPTPLEEGALVVRWLAATLPGVDTVTERPPAVTSSPPPRTLHAAARCLRSAPARTKVRRSTRPSVSPSCPRTASSLGDFHGHEDCHQRVRPHRPLCPPRSPRAQPW